MVKEADLKEKICEICHVAMLEPHPDKYQWFRCPVCGFQKEIKKEPKIKMI